MTALAPLQTSVPLPLLPDDAAWMARTTLEQTVLLGYQPFHIDAVSNLGLGLFGTCPAVRHVSCATDEILHLMTLAGHRIEEITLLYQTGDEAHAHARRLTRQGYRLFSPYPLPEGMYDDRELLVPPSLWRSLNAKTRLQHLVPSGNLAHRCVATDFEARTRPFTGPVWLKIASDDATGWGYAVRYCQDAVGYQAALRELCSLGRTSHLIIEEHVDTTRSWGAHVVVRASDVVYAGAAEQTFDGPGRLSGSVIDPEEVADGRIAELMLKIGEAARAMGFLGMAACDIGLATDGRLVVFDPNFRITSSTHQVLTHGSAARRSDMPASASVSIKSSLAFPEIARQLADWISNGRFIPTRLLDARYLEAAAGNSLVAGFMTGKTPANAHEAIAQLKSGLAA